MSARPTGGRTQAKPGAVLRAIRLRRGWTLSEVSQRTGLPVSTLSKVENDKMSLTFDKLTRISAGLEIDISELFGSAIVDEADSESGNATGRRSITRSGEGKVIETANYEHVYAAADLLNKRFLPIIADIKARNLEDFGDLIRHAGEEFAFVVEGEVEFHTDLYAPVRLKAGDSIYFDSGMGHAYLNAGAGPCRVLSVCSGAEAQVIAASRPERGAQDSDLSQPAPRALRVSRR